jgi:hypothetical protein
MIAPPGERSAMSTPSDRTNNPRADGPPQDGGPYEAASFIAETVSELSQVARRHGFDMLGFLLDMAQLEAEERVRHSDK